MNEIKSHLLPNIQIEQIVELNDDNDLHGICETLEAAILAGYHCKWVNPPPRELIENYFRGVCLVPEKNIFVARMDGNIVAVCEADSPAKQPDSPYISASIKIFAIAPYACNMDIEKRLLSKAEQIISQLGFPIINIIIDETQTELLNFYKENNYQHWATHPYYQRINGQIVKGFCLYKSFLNS